MQSRTRRLFRAYGHILIVLGIFIALFNGGRFYALYTARPAQIANGCAHYDPMTGDFKWGAAIMPLLPEDITPSTGVGRGK